MMRAGLPLTAGDHKLAIVLLAVSAAVWYAWNRFSQPVPEGGAASRTEESESPPEEEQPKAESEKSSKGEPAEAS